MNDQIGVFTGVSFEEYQAIDALNGSSACQPSQVDHLLPPLP